MLSAMAYRGPDGLNHLCTGPLVLGHALLKHRADAAQLPCQVPGTELYLTLDGRLDNPGELTAALGLAGNASEPELIAAAYHHWGDTFPLHLDGDFALALWDVRRQRLLCARDHTGTRPFYYCQGPGFFAFASELPPLLDLIEGAPQPDQGMITQFLAQCWLSNEDTFWESCRRLPPAHTLVVQGAQVQLQRYWQPDFQQTLEYPHLQDYRNHYRELLADVVGRQSRSDHPVAFEVSGGLDSSALFAVASDLQSRGDLPAPDLAGYTLDFRGCGDADEVAYAQAVARHCDRPLVLVPPTHKPLDWYRQRGRRRGEFCNAPNGVMSVGLLQRAAAAGSRVLVNGTGGDEWLDCGYAAYAEAAGRGQFAAFTQMLRNQARRDGWLRSLESALRAALAGNLSPTLKDLLRCKPTSTPEQRRQLSPGRLQKLKALQAGHREGCDRPPQAASWQQPLWQQLHESYALLAHETMEVLAAESGLELRRPYWSRRLVEFSISLPRRVLTAPGENRGLHRTALGALLPAAVLAREDKAEFSASFQDLTAAVAVALAGGRPDVGPDWLQPDAFDALLASAQNAKTGEANWPLWFLFSCAAVLEHAG